MMLKGLTAQYLLRQTYRVQPGDTVPIDAATNATQDAEPNRFRCSLRNH